MQHKDPLQDEDVHFLDGSAGLDHGRAVCRVGVVEIRSWFAMECRVVRWHLSWVLKEPILRDHCRRQRPHALADELGNGGLTRPTPASNPDDQRASAYPRRNLCGGLNSHLTQSAVIELEDQVALCRTAVEIRLVVMNGLRGLAR